MAPEHKNYSPIRVDEFTVGLKTPADLFVRTGEESFQKLYSAGDKTEPITFVQFNQKSIQYIWIKNEDLSKMSQHNVIIAGIAIKSDRYTNQEKSRFLAAAGATLFNDISVNGVSIKNYNQAKEVSAASLKLLEAHQDLYNIMESFSICNDLSVKFSMTVANMGVVIATGMGWRNPITMEKIALGGMLHKIGILTLPKTINSVNPEQLSEEELRLYKSYPLRGVSTLKNVSVVPDDILSIVLEHQERVKAKGFPRGLSDAKIHPMARVVGLAEAYTQALFMPENKFSPDRAHKYLVDTQREDFNREVFNALGKMLGRNTLNRDAA